MQLKTIGGGGGGGGGGDLGGGGVGFSAILAFWAAESGEGSRTFARSSAFLAFSSLSSQADKDIKITADKKYFLITILLKICFATWNGFIF